MGPSPGVSRMTEFQEAMTILRLRFLVFALVACAASAATTGCATKMVTDDFPDQERISYDGGFVSTYVWENADSFDAENPPRKEWRFTWLLPLNIYQKLAEFESSHKLAVRKNTYNGLGFPLLFLPLRYSSQESLYGHEDVYPIHRARTEWNLLYAKSRVSEDWPEGRPSLYAQGYPLFFSKGTLRDLGTYSGRRSDVTGWQTLWSIGPAYLKYKSREADRSEPRNEQRATVGMPLALGGFLGTILWLDTDAVDHKEYTRERLQVHGPLFGMLGFFRTDTQSRWNQVPEMSGEDDPRRLGYREYSQGLLAGLLWYDHGTEYVALPETENSGHGPIWSMFGWGRKNGEQTIRVFWIPIRV